MQNLPPIPPQIPGIPPEDGKKRKRSFSRKRQNSSSPKPPIWKRKGLWIAVGVFVCLGIIGSIFNKTEQDTSDYSAIADVSEVIEEEPIIDDIPAEKEEVKEEIALSEEEKEQLQNHLVKSNPLFDTQAEADPDDDEDVELTEEEKAAFRDMLNSLAGDEYDETLEALEDVPEPKVLFVLNTDSGIFHRPSCFQVERMKEEHKREIYDNENISLSDLRDLGYSPCGICYK